MGEVITDSTMATLLSTIAHRRIPHLGMVPADASLVVVRTDKVKVTSIGKVDYWVEQTVIDKL